MGEVYLAARESGTGKLPRPLQDGVEPIRVGLESKLVPIEELLPTFPQGIAEFVMNSLAPDTADRYQDAGLFIAI